MIDKETLKFLHAAARHPSRDWLDDHRTGFDRAKADLKEFVRSLMNEASSVDGRIAIANPEIEKAFGRAVGTQIRKGYVALSVRVASDPNAIATYFVHVQPGGCYSGGGSRTPTTRFSRLLRQQMMTDTGRWREIVEGPVFRRFFPNGLTDGNSAVPAASFVKNHDAMDSLNLRAFGACHEHSDQRMQSNGAVGEIVRSFAAARPLVDFINRATTR
jgi:uncharacterized protein (DUF2461 family)